MRQANGRTALAILGSAIICYAVAVLSHVITSPDLRLRSLLADSQSGKLPGVQIESTEGVIAWSDIVPQLGDRTVRINDQPIENFMMFSNIVMGLNKAEIQAGGDNTDDELAVLKPKLETYPFPPLLSTKSGRRIVRVDIYRPQSGEELTTWLEVQSQPLGSVVMTIVWFLFELGITLVGAIAFWKRPFDRSARQFLTMSIVTMGAFVGGYHWWAIAGNLWLNIPFVICASLLPVVTLHFFMMYPRPKPLLNQRPISVLVSLYVLPVVAMVVMAGLVIGITHLGADESASEADRVDRVMSLLVQLRSTIYAYVTVSGGYFLLTQIALIHGFFTTRNPIEHKQVQAIMWAGIVAMPPLGYTLYLAHVNPVAFALGSSRLPMFMASLSFMLAYAYGILRYKLMVADQLVTRGMMYYVVTFGVSGLTAMVAAAGVMIPHLTDQAMTIGQESVLYFMLVLIVLLLVAVRDRVQRYIDRRFFREKYQLDKALQRVNRAIGNLVDQDALAEMMLNSSCEVLQVNRAALYLRNSNRTAVTLAAVKDMKSIPVDIANFDEIVDELRDVGTLQRVVHGSRETMSPAQRLLHEFHAELLHGLEVNDNFAGLVVLGAKKGNAHFTAEDLTFLHATSQITNVALYGARLNQDMNRLNEELQIKVERVAEQRRQIAMLQAELTSSRDEEVLGHDKPAESDEQEFHRGPMKGNSPAIQQVLSMVQKVANSDSSVLIRGESGTGKELVAKAIYQHSLRNKGPFRALNCAAIPETLLESEMFGHEKGAFTGADRRRIGHFEQAHQGTLFLDEVGDMSAMTQSKLLRVLQERTLERVGGNETIQVDVRVIAATNHDLEQRVAEGRFRADLFFRLRDFMIKLPPLRERGDDVRLLAEHFIRKHSSALGRTATQLADATVDVLRKATWPGNVRELESVIKQSLLSTTGSALLPEFLPEELGGRGRSSTAAAFNLSQFVKQQLQHSETTDLYASVISNTERELLNAVLRHTSGNQVQASAILGISRVTLRNKLRQLGINAASFG